MDSGSSTDTGYRRRRRVKKCLRSELAQCVHMGWQGAPPPRPPDRDTARCADSSPGRRCGRRRVWCRQDHERPTIPGVRQRTVSHGRQTASLRPSVTARGRPCGKALAGQPRGWPSFKTNKPSACAAPLSPRTGAEIASATTGPMPTSRRRAAHRPQRTGTAAGAEAQQITERTSRTTATRSARWRRKATRRGGSRSRGRARKCDLLLLPDHTGTGAKITRLVPQEGCNRDDVIKLQPQSHPESHSQPHVVPSKPLILLTKPDTYDPSMGSGIGSGVKRGATLAKLAFSGPGRCSSVTPAGPGRSPRNLPVPEGDRRLRRQRTPTLPGGLPARIAAAYRHRAPTRERKMLLVRPAPAPC